MSSPYARRIEEKRAVHGAERIVSRAHVPLLLLLSVPLTFVYLAQALVFIRGYQDLRVFVCLLELLFVGAVLFHPGRGRDAAGVPAAAAGWLFLAWLAAASISVALSAQPIQALIRQAEWVCHALFAFTLWRHLRRHPRHVKWILVMIPLGFFLVGLVLVAFWFSLQEPARHNWWNGTPFFPHVRYLGYYALAALPFCAAPLLNLGARAAWRDHLPALAAMTFCWTFLFWTGGRAAAGSAVVGLALVVWFAAGRQRIRVAGAAALAALAGGWLSTLFQVSDPRMGFFASIERTTTAASINTLSTGRLGIWTETLHAVREHLWFGLGPEGYRYLDPKPFGVHPHNVLLQFLVEWGLIGAALMLALLALVFHRSFVLLRRETVPRQKTARVAAFALLVAFTVHSLVDGLYYHAVPLMLLFASVAVALLPTKPDEGAASPVFARLTAPPTLSLTALTLALLFTGYYVAFFL